MTDMMWQAVHSATDRYKAGKALGPRQQHCRMPALRLLAAAVWWVSAATAAAAAPPRTKGAHAEPPPPRVRLRNGVEMPFQLLGMGLWCNDAARCPAPEPPCHDCFNDSAAQDLLALAFSAGFRGVDTAAGYGNQAGVGLAVRAWEQANASTHGSVFVQTKIPPCHAAMSVGECTNTTAAAFERDLAELGAVAVDSMLLHGPPTNGTKGDACRGVLCALAQAQWAVLEQMLEAGKARSIGVSNYCSTCVECLKRSATVLPMVNQIQYHAGMPGADPTGLVSYCRSNGIEPQAYSPLGNYATHSLIGANLTNAIGRRYNRSAAQVALRWVVQNNVTMAVAADKTRWMQEDLALFDWQLSAEDMGTLDNCSIAQEDPTRGVCEPVRCAASP